MSRIAVHKPTAARPTVVPALTPRSRLALMRCGGVNCPPGSCGHDGELQLRRDGPGNRPVTTAPPVVLEVLRSPGVPLDGRTSAEMGERFGWDFSHVRVHADIRAAESARAVDSFAYTVGRDIVFAAGRYDPASTVGRRLLAHELAHVVQQTAAVEGGGQITARPFGQARATPESVETKPEIGAPDDALESEADRCADQVMRIAQVDTPSAAAQARSLGPSTPATPFVRGTVAGELAQAARPARSAPLVQRYAYCTPARLSGRDCPPREQGEVDRARSGPMVFLPTLKLDTGETGVLIANFDISKPTIKSNLHSTIYWKEFLRRISADGSRWTLVGFSDCEGNEKDNAALRDQRARAVFALLPNTVQTRIDSHKGAGSGECITENDTARDRTLNRSVAFLLLAETIVEPREVITDTLERKEPETEDCSADQKKQLAVAVPLAKRLAEHAIQIINSMKKGSAQEALLKKFFGPDAFSERHHIVTGYQDALRAWRDLPTYKCVKQGIDPCSGSSTSGYTGFRGLTLGSPIIICDYSFGDGLELADTVLHEETHALAWTRDKEECGKSGCSLPTTSESLPGIRLSDSGALNNAASYSRFASQAYAQGF